MCGIAGYSIGTGVIPHTKALILAKDALAHRGPDDWGLFTEALHGIGYRDWETDRKSVV